jgi:hypothetical protein
MKLLKPWGPATRVGIGWTLIVVVVAKLAGVLDPLTAWEDLLDVLFFQLVPILALFVTLGLYGGLGNSWSPAALAARHGANRQRLLIAAMARALILSVIVTAVALVLSRQVCHPATEALWTRDLVMCCGIGCLATGAYIGYLSAATRIGLGRFGAWAALAIDLTLGHVDAGWSILLPHRHVFVLIGHPGIALLSGRASSLILLGFTVVGLTTCFARTPR